MLGEGGEAATKAKERALNLLDLAECSRTSPDEGEGEQVRLETVCVASMWVTAWVAAAASGSQPLSVSVSPLTVRRLSIRWDSILQ